MHETIQGTGPITLHAIHYVVESPRATLLIVHGLGEHIGRYGELAAYLAGEGIAVLGFDQRGHGASPGRRGHIDHYSDYVDDVESASARLAEHYPATPQFILGHSLGANNLLAYLLSTSHQPRGAILSSPVLGTDGVSGVKVLVARLLSRIAPRMQVSLGLDTSNLSRDPSVEPAYLADPLVHGKASTRFGTESLLTIKRILRNAHMIPCPVLLAHGDADRIASASALDELWGRLTVQDRERVIFPGGYHEPHNDVQKQEVFALYRDWILARV